MRIYVQVLTSKYTCLVQRLLKHIYMFVCVTLQLCEDLCVGASICVYKVIRIYVCLKDMM